MDFVFSGTGLLLSAVSLFVLFIYPGYVSSLFLAAVFKMGFFPLRGYLSREGARRAKEDREHRRLLRGHRRKGLRQPRASSGECSGAAPSKPREFAGPWPEN